MRRLLCIFLLMLLPLHGFAVQVGWLSAENVFDIAHEVEHLQAISHHHDDDGSVHYDESSESTAHSADHAASHSQQYGSLPSVVVPLLTIHPFTIRLQEPSYHVPAPFLKVPQRPPSRLG